MAGRKIDPFAGGKLTMDESTFKAAREMLTKPPGHPANAVMHERIYYAAMVLDHRQRALEAAAKGGQVPQDFICPVCRVPMDQNYILKTFECKPCGRGITPDAIVGMFHSNPVPFTAQPNKAHNSTTGLSHQFTNSAYPKTYVPRLTSPIPPELKPEDLIDKVHEQRTEQDAPVVMWRSWRLHPEPASPGETVFGNDIEAGLRYITSINGTVWPHKAPLKADHHGNRGQHGDEGCPDWHCNCGIYTVKTLVQAQQWAKNTSGHGAMQVVGKVVCWGRVLVFETGAKAQYAYPQKLFISPSACESREVNPDLIANELAAQYGIPVEVEDGMYDLGLASS